MTSCHTPSGFIQEKTKWRLGALIYVTVVLTTIQVGLATDRLSGDKAFQRATFGFTISAILAPLIVFSFVLTLIMIGSLYYLRLSQI